MTSSILPTLILPPKPPLAVGHRNATKPAAANVVRLAPVNETVARLKNWRRLTPMASSSGGTHTTGVDGAAATRPVLRAWLTARSTARPVWPVGQIDVGVFVAPARLTAQRTRAANVGAAGGRDEDDRRQDDDDERRRW